MEEIKVKNIAVCHQGKNSENYQKYKKIIKEKNIKDIVVKKGDEILIENNLKIKILWPKEKQISENILNNNSIVLKINYKNNFSMIFTGDIEIGYFESRASWFKNINYSRISRKNIS